MIIENAKVVTSEEGVTFTPWTDGWAVGFEITAPDMPTRWIFLNPSGGTDSGDILDSDVFAYHARGEDSDSLFDNPVCFINVWEK